MNKQDQPLIGINASLPITNHGTLRRALQEGEVPSLLMVHTYFTHDRDLLDRFEPYINSIFDLPKEIPAELLQELQDKLFDVLTRDPAPKAVPPDEALFRRMLSVAVGEPVAEEFIPMLKEQMGFEPPEARSERPKRAAPRDDFKVLVIGAGLTGMLAAIKLREAGYDYQVIEKNSDIGGTWLENTYPGCGVDTPSHFYSYSFELNPDWSHYTPAGPEFQQYLQGVAAKYDLRKDIVFNTCVTSCEFDEQTETWKVTLDDEDGRREMVVNAIINAHGPLNRWKWPEIEGLQEFGGALMHTARWDHSVSLKGKRVALLGTGASGVQVGTSIVDEVEHLTVLQRSRHWVMPNHYIEVSESVRWAQQNIPHYAEWFRFRSYWFAADGLYQNIQVDWDWPHQDRSVSAANDMVREYCLGNYREKLADRPDLLDKLIPDYPVFGKRIVMDINWLNTLKRDDVSLETSAIDHVTEDAIVLKDGTRIEVDVIVCATGFDTANMVGIMDIVGRGGRSLREEWKDDPRGYLGVAVPGYPNYFMTVGPNSAPNHAGGQNITSESQIHYALECLELLQQTGARAMEPTLEATQDFNDKVDDALKDLIWLHPTAPKSYYKNEKGRNFMSCPYRLVDYWRMTRTPVPDDYKFTYVGSAAELAAAN